MNQEDRDFLKGVYANHPDSPKKTNQAEESNWLAETRLLRRIIIEEISASVERFQAMVTTMEKEYEEKIALVAEQTNSLFVKHGDLKQRLTSIETELIGSINPLEQRVGALEGTATEEAEAEAEPKPYWMTMDIPTPNAPFPLEGGDELACEVVTNVARAVQRWGKLEATLKVRQHPLYIREKFPRQVSHNQIRLLALGETAKGPGKYVKLDGSPQMNIDVRKAQAVNAALADLLAQPDAGEATE